MGYSVDIQSVKFEHNLKVLPEGVDGYWEFSKREPVQIQPLDWSFNWHEDDFESTLILLAKAGVTGEIELMGEQGDYWKYVLTEKEVKYYDGEVVYHEKPDKTLLLN